MAYVEANGKKNKGLIMKVAKKLDEVLDAMEDYEKETGGKQPIEVTFKKGGKVSFKVYSSVFKGKK